jgi:hypothetical protein
VAAALLTSGLLLADSGRSGSATYDEVAYLEVASAWWREGTQERITRMGSPLSFWKLQQAPVLWALDRAGAGHLVDDPHNSQATVLPMVRLASIWIALAALLVTSAWAWDDHGPRAGLLSAWLFALSPNLLAHGALVTMEMPLIAGCAAMFWLFSRFLARGDRVAFWLCAVVGGFVFSCKFTAVVIPPLLGLAWWVELVRQGGASAIRKATLRVVPRMAGFLAVMLVANVVVTGGASLPISEGRGEHPSLGPPSSTLATLGRALLEAPIPQDWAGFARQMQHQRSGGPSYLLGERHMTGWWYYYLICLAVKVPPSLWLLVGARLVLRRRIPATAGDRMVVGVMLATLLLVSLGSSRNYGYRYVLFLAPAAIVWISGLAVAGRRGRALGWAGVVGQALAVASIHPYELSYFSPLVGGPEAGRHVLADSNLDWGQGLRSLARLQREQPPYRDLTVFYFGDTSPTHYGVAGDHHVVNAHGPLAPLPPLSGLQTTYVAVSRSLQFGPWGPAGHFRALDAIEPVAVLADHTMAIYRTADLRPSGGARH